MVLPRHVYVHVPFCARRCSYCDFAIAVRRVVPVDAYTQALARELELRFDEGGEWTADTLYFGGGTPSRLGGEGIARLLDEIRRRIELSADAEGTIEAHPEDIDCESIRRWRKAGVNRLSSVSDKRCATLSRTALPRVVTTNSARFSLLSC